MMKVENFGCVTKQSPSQLAKNQFQDKRPIQIRPVIMSAKRFQNIVGRANREPRKQIEDENRYTQYLKEGNEALCNHFAKATPDTTEKLQDEKTRQILLDCQATSFEIDQKRKERVLRATKILDQLKPGQRALHSALIESETAYQRKVNADLKREIAEEATRQKRLNDQKCPERLIPFLNFSEEQLAAVEKERALTIRTELLEDIENRRQRKLFEKKKEILEGLLEREQYRCLKALEDGLAKKVAKRKRDFCRRAYQEALKEKAAVVRFEKKCDEINDRIICMDVTSHHNLSNRCNKECQARRQERAAKLEAHAIRHCQLQQVKKYQEQNMQVKNEMKHQKEQENDEKLRRHAIQLLSQDRQRYASVERDQAKERCGREKELRRFGLALRLKNQDCFREYVASEKQCKVKEAREMYRILDRQRSEALNKRFAELVQIDKCEMDPYLPEDVKYFERAANMVDKARIKGKSIYPIKKAVNDYWQKNKVVIMPKGTSLSHRPSTGIHENYKTDLIYRKYDQQKTCRRMDETTRLGILANCIKITLADDEEPTSPSNDPRLIKYEKHDDLPATKTDDLTQLSEQRLEDERQVSFNNALVNEADIELRETSSRRKEPPKSQLYLNHISISETL
ncbi:hypothetical protein KR222_000915 [Zaprionus bogoriensis]|nr:hypothetical protein KR222_000915 [Zaprionus bogoriensis]